MYDIILRLEKQEGKINMKEIEAKIYYIYHSGFAIKTKNHFLVFDYYKEPIENDETNDNSYKCYHLKILKI